MKRWMLYLCAVAVTPALAQTGADGTARQLDAGRLAAMQDWSWRAQQGAVPTEPEKAVRAVLDAVTQRDCAAAVKQLNAGLAKAYPEVYTLAGGFYEEGVCVKANWERAVSLYQRAQGQGHPGVAARLAAGYAAPVGGPDKAAALWWAYRAKTALPSACTGAAAQADDPDRFVAALQAWPAHQLDGCVYVAGVMARLQADIEDPGLAKSLGLAGQVKVNFVPAKSQIEVAEKTAEARMDIGRLAEGVARGDDEKAARLALGSYLRERADKALQRYAKPAELPADWRADAAYALQPQR